MTSEQLQTQMLVGLAIAQAIEILKRSRYFPWMQAHQKNLQRAISLIAGLGATFGVVATYDPTMAGGTLTITGLQHILSVEGLTEIISTFVVQMIANQGAYTGLVQRGALRTRQVVMVERGADVTEVERATVAAVREAFEKAHTTPED